MRRKSVTKTFGAHKTRIRQMRLHGGDAGRVVDEIAKGTTNKPAAETTNLTVFVRLVTLIEGLLMSPDGEKNPF